MIKNQKLLGFVFIVIGVLTGMHYYTAHYVNQIHPPDLLAGVLLSLITGIIIIGYGRKK